MHIAINAMFWQQPTVGSGQYLRGLVAALAEHASQPKITLILPPDHPIPQDLPSSVMWIQAAQARPLKSGFAKLYFEQIAVPEAALCLGADILHVPYFAAPIRIPLLYRNKADPGLHQTFRPGLRECFFPSRLRVRNKVVTSLNRQLPVAVTILDLIPLKLPAYRGKRQVRMYMQLVAQAARCATHVLAISEHARSEIVDYLKIPYQRTTVTPLAAAPQFRPMDRELARAEVAQRYGISEPFVYYVGGLDMRKNVPTLIRAFAHMRRCGGPGVKLVIAGKALGNDPQLFPDIDAVIAEEQAQAWVMRVQVPYEDGALLYNAAQLFAAPSRYEGFGLGPLEAMACATPVIAANASSLPEVVGDAALCVDPDDIVGWTAALWRLAADASLREDLGQRGLRRAAAFSYAHTAELTLEAYQGMLNVKC